jgi:hypothetical protein
MKGSLKVLSFIFICCCVISGDSKKLAGLFVRESLSIQFGIATVVSGKINSSVILFTADKQKFANAPVLVVDNYRYLQGLVNLVC